MTNLNERLYKYTWIVLFLIGIILISYSMIFWAGLLVCFLFVASMFNTKNRTLLIQVAFFLVGFLAYKYLGTVLKEQAESREIRIIIDRCLLSLVVLSMFISSRILNKTPIEYLHKPKWNSPIFFPYIVKGFHSMKTSGFLTIAIFSNIVFFVVFIYLKGIDITLSLLLFGVAFSIVNGILEEIIWRGILLRRFMESTGELQGMIVSSVGFGLQHISIGIPIVPSLLLSIGGVFFAVIVLRTDSLYPSMIWHIVINMGMVFSGMIV